MLKSFLWATALALLVPVASLRAATTAEEALQKQYPNAKFQKIAEDEANGVKYASYRVTTDKGETRAVVTENGDFISAGFPGVNSAKDLPQPVQDLVSSMFTSPPQRVSRTDYTTYVANLDIGQRNYAVEIDPLGRIRDIRGATELKLEDPSRLEKASDREVESLQPRLKQFFGDPKVKNVYRYPGAQSFFLVDLSTSRDPDVRLVMNPHGDIAYWRVKTDEAQVPKAVSDTVRNYFRSAKLRDAYRNQDILYSVVEPAGRNETMTFNFTAAGDIHDIVARTTRPRGDAEPTGREKPSDTDNSQRLIR